MMLLIDYIEQDKYCRENNTPEGPGCDECPGKDADECADFIKSEKMVILQCDQCGQQYVTSTPTGDIETTDIPIGKFVADCPCGHGRGELYMYDTM